MPYTKKQYDVIVIGAGVGGLVCGCFLAKAGMKVLIVEKNPKPGGYCSSFERDGFHFDACVHSLGSLREGGIIWNILRELSIDKRMEIIRYDPSDIIIAPEYKISFWNDLDKTVQEFQDNFPKEARNIKEFFDYLTNTSGIYLAELRKKTFGELLKQYFKDNRLKAILSLPLLGNAGLPPSMISAFTAVMIYKEYIIDGGHYPNGGVQVFPDILLERFKEFGGDVLLSKFAKEIKVKNNKAEGVTLEENIFVPAKYIVSSIDARQTFYNLLGEKAANENMINKLNDMMPSLSVFVLYLGIDEGLEELPNVGSTWLLSHYNIDDMYISVKNGNNAKLIEYLLCVYKNNRTITIFVNAPFKNKFYWSRNKSRLSDNLIKKTKEIVPDLSKHIVLKDVATPNTLYRRTLNYKGASYGWASIPSQFAISNLSQTTHIKNLYLTGHWTTLLQGVPGVAYLGRDTAKIILRREKK